MRDFQKEYEKYVNEETPNLWDRIEPQLKDKNQTTDEKPVVKFQDVEFGEVKFDEVKFHDEDKKEDKNTKNAKVISIFVKRAMPAVAAVCVLVVGFGIFNISKSSNDSSAAMDSAAGSSVAYEDEAPMMAESADEEMYEADMDECAEEASVAEVDAEYEKAASDSSDTPLELNGDKKETVATNDVQDNGEVMEAGIFTDDQFAQSSTVLLESVTLIGIGKTDADMEADGYVYEYRFKTKDGENVTAFLTDEKRDEVENGDILIERKGLYEIEVIPYLNKQNDGNETEENYCILLGIRKK